MKAEIITIGDEILIGQIIDTNSAFISKELNNIGIDIYQITSISDEKTHILDTLLEAEKRVDLVIITGGLGPTNDDITKHTLCEYFGDTLVKNEEVLKHVEGLFDKYIKSPISEVNKQQALIPSKSEVLHNEFGTAPGMWIQHNDTVFVSMPGVPFEMKGIVTNHMIPKLQREFERPYIQHKTILTYGVGESRIAEMIEDWENNLPPFIKLAYLPNLGRVRLRLSARGKDLKALEDGINKAVEDLKPLIGDIIVGYDEDENIEKVIANILTKNRLTLSISESCTGGKITQAFTKMEGASAYFRGSMIPYATDIKSTVLGVDSKTIAAHSVVSEAVATSMADRTKTVFESDFSIATTGNAGPTKGDSDAEVGTVFIAIGTPNGIRCEKFIMSNHRQRTIGKATNKAFEMLLEEIEKNLSLVQL